MEDSLDELVTGINDIYLKSFKAQTEYLLEGFTIRNVPCIPHAVVPLNIQLEQSLLEKATGDIGVKGVLFARNFSTKQRFGSDARFDWAEKEPGQMYPIPRVPDFVKFLLFKDDIFHVVISKDGKTIGAFADTWQSLTESRNSLTFHLRASGIPENDTVDLFFRLKDQEKNFMGSRKRMIGKMREVYGYSGLLKNKVFKKALTELLSNIETFSLAQERLKLFGVNYTLEDYRNNNRDFENLFVDESRYFDFVGKDVNRAIRIGNHFKDPISNEALLSLYNVQDEQAYQLICKVLKYNDFNCRLS